MYRSELTAIAEWLENSSQREEDCFPLYFLVSLWIRLQRLEKGFSSRGGSPVSVEFPEAFRAAFS